MKANMPYDCVGVDGVSNAKAFKKLPPTMQFTIRTIQNSIQTEVDSKNPGKFQPTSGFRSEDTNIRNDGQLESLHRLGCARDYVPVKPFTFNDGAPVVDSSRFRVFRSPLCWHVVVII